MCGDGYMEVIRGSEEGRRWAARGGGGGGCRPITAVTPSPLDKIHRWISLRLPFFSLFLGGRGGGVTIT